MGEHMPLNMKDDEVKLLKEQLAKQQEGYLYSKVSGRVVKPSKPQKRGPKSDAMGVRG